MNERDLENSDFEHILHSVVQNIAWDRQSDCPSFDDQYAFVERTLPESRRQEIATHVATCAHCTAFVGRIFKAHRTYERDRRRSQRQTVQRMKAEGLWTPIPWWGLLLRLLGLVTTESSGSSVSVHRLRPMAWVACFGIGILLAVNGYVAVLWVHERGKNAGLQQALEQVTLRSEAAVALHEETQDLIEVMNPHTPTETVMRKIQGIEVLDLPTGTEQLPFPTFRPETRHPRLTTALAQHTDLYADYTAFLKQWSEVFIQLGDLLVQTGKLEAAIKVFAHVARKFPDEKRLHFALGGLYRMLGDANPEDTDRFRLYHEKAIAIWEEMSKWSPKDPRPLHYAGFSYFQLREYEKALDFYDKALKLFPGYAKVYFNKALLYREMQELSAPERQRLFQENFQKALQLTQEAYRKDKSNPRIPFTLAVLHAEIGEIDQAIGSLEKAIRLNPFYITWAENERAFRRFRTNPDFVDLLNRYRPSEPEKFGLEPEVEFNPEHFPE
ncbi:tetratricopeptide repeat protein [Candidatus Poribacteria bacterium]|nr:tetratricopeptide repeat protein [Candidatus Poribacteria bacterium]